MRPKDEVDSPRSFLPPGPPPIVRDRWGRVAALAAIIGGLAWIAKGAWTLITLDQPPVLYEVGPPLFLVATWGLWGSLPRETIGSGGARVALLVATILFVVAAVVAVVTHFAPTPPDTLSSVTALLAMLSFLFALGWTGLLVRRTENLPPKHGLPLGLAAALLPLLFLFGVAGIMIGGMWEDRLIEVPIVLWGLGWVWVGRLSWLATPSSRNPTPPN